MWALFFVGYLFMFSLFHYGLFELHLSVADRFLKMRETLFTGDDDHLSGHVMVDVDSANIIAEETESVMVAKMENERIGVDESCTNGSSHMKNHSSNLAGNQSHEHSPSQVLTVFLFASFI